MDWKMNSYINAKNLIFTIFHLLQRLTFFHIQMKNQGKPKGQWAIIRYPEITHLNMPLLLKIAEAIIHNWTIVAQDIHLSRPDGSYNGCVIYKLQK